MKAYVIAAVAALIATPTLAADFTGPRVGATVGVVGNDVGSTDTASVGVNAGYDFKLVPGVVAGMTVEYQRTTKSTDLRDVSVTARLGAPLTNNVMVYALGGYTNLGVEGVGIDGFRVGGGLELALTDKVSATVEQRYSEYEFGLKAYQTVAGVSFRF